MRIAVFSDIHSNWQALQATLADAEQQGAEELWCLGDVVGYGPAPARCWSQLAHSVDLPSGTWIAGNHDWGLVGRLEAHFFQSLMQEEKSAVGDFSQHAWDALLKQRDVLKFNNELFTTLNALPVLASPLLGVYMAHGVLYEDNTPGRTAMIGTYATVSEHAARSLRWLSEMLPNLNNGDWDGVSRVAVHGWHQPRLMLVGHTHIARIWQSPDDKQEDATWRWLERTPEVETKMVWFEDLVGHPVFANPGSVGFARDRAGYATYLLVEWQGDRVGLWLRRVAYDASETITQMMSMGIAQKVINQLRNQ